MQYASAKRNQFGRIFCKTRIARNSSHSIGATGHAHWQRLQPDRGIFQGKNYLPVALVETSRGCPFQCDFCSIGAVFQGSYRRRPVQEIVEELRQVHDKYVFFVDDNIVGDPAGARELFEAITPLEIQWMSQGSLHALKDESLGPPDGPQRLHGIAGRL